MLQDIICVPRTDAIYNMHGYLTKVPVGVIIPFINEYTPENGLVVDMFAGSGMTALAAKITNRNALVSDISKLGQHIAIGYMSPVSVSQFSTIAKDLVAQSKNDIGWLYKTVRLSDNSEVEAIRTIWSFTYRCNACEKPVQYYDALKSSGWDSKKMQCPTCNASFIKKSSKMVGEEPVLVVVKDGKQVEQPITERDLSNLQRASELDYQNKIPSKKIDKDREMYKRSALEKWGLTETKLFFSQRNSAILYDLWKKINVIESEALRQKLKFCFTAILPRSSKRYQWSIKAPLNAANQNYYVAPVFYEWNVYDLFLRKIEAVLKSDALLFSSSGTATQEYITASADDLSHIKDGTVDLVFTDPPFGSNIFYSDMNLFQEAWLGETTNHENEAVIRTTASRPSKEASKVFYKELLKKSFQEAYRILKPGGVISIVFGNSKGNVWELAQSAFIEAGFENKPISINILDKGQRSVKGLNSGSENVATLDLIVTLRKTPAVKKPNCLAMTIDDIVTRTLDQLNEIEGYTASHIYLEVLKNAMYNNINVGSIDLSHILKLLKDRELTPSLYTGKLQRVGDKMPV